MGTQSPLLQYVSSQSVVSKIQVFQALEIKQLDRNFPFEQVVFQVKCFQVARFPDYKGIPPVNWLSFNVKEETGKFPMPPFGGERFVQKLKDLIHFKGLTYQNL